MVTPKRTVRLSDDDYAWCREFGGAAQILQRLRQACRPFSLRPRDVETADAARKIVGMGSVVVPQKEASNGEA